MNWRYTLIDRFGNRTRIDQPVGWDALSFKLKRHAERHGTFRELQTNQFHFYNHGGELLHAEYEQWGIRGRYELLIEGRCGSGWEQLYRGRVSFDNFSFVCGNECYAAADCDQLGPVVDFINRFDQKVEIGSLVAFDKTTALTDYESLTKTISLPSKAILLRVSASLLEAQEYRISDDSGWFPVSGTGFLQGSISIPFTSVDVNNMSQFTAQAVTDYFNFSNFNEQPPAIITNIKTEDLNCVGTLFSVEWRVKGRFKNLVAGSGDHTLALNIKKGPNEYVDVTATVVQGYIVHAGSNTVFTYEFDISWSGSAVLLPGEKLWLNHFLSYDKFTNYDADVRIEFDPETSFEASVISKCDPTDSKVYLVHETTSNVIENITNNALKLSSSYYGRKDSLPYSFPADGCGGLRALTTGLDIRRAKLSDGSDPKLFLSMKDIFESLCAIDNIGLGPDGTDKIVMENWRYFYQDEVIFTCRNIEQVEKVNAAGENYSLFKVGYDKWETEDYDGLDEFLTKREFRTELSEVQNSLEKFCKFIASGYAWETTRRKGPDSKDWRYDNDTFILCLDKGYRGAVGIPSTTEINLPRFPNDDFQVGDSVTIDSPLNHGTFTIISITSSAGWQLVVDGPLVSEGLTSAHVVNNTRPTFATEVNNIVDAANLLDPASVYNFRISPLRNALRWFNRIANCYRNITDTDALIFTAGDGNYLATGLLSEELCRLEAAAIAENAEINLAVFADEDEGKPFTRPERIKYTYPVSFEEYKLLQANAYKLIEYISKCERGTGWIDEIEYIPEEGRAKFTLIPKVQ